MNFIEQIIKNGFIEKLKLKDFNYRPDKEKWIPKWWINYPFESHWLGVSKDHPDALFEKNNKKVLLSLQGFQIDIPNTLEDILLLEAKSSKYICLKINNNKIYETFSGKIPSQETINNFLTC